MTSLGAFRAAWGRPSLATRFALAAGVVLLAAMLATGAVVTARLEATVVRNSANATALFMESVIAPIGQQLAQDGAPSPGVRRALEEIFENTALGERVLSYKFWRADGRVIWAEDAGLAGRAFPPTPELARAFAGEVVAEFDALGDAEDAAEAATGLPLLEIYSPIRAAWSGEVIAVAEFYEVAPDLAADLRGARRGAWAAVAASTLTLGAVLHLIVLGGSRTIEAQRRDLDARLAELRDLSAKNTDLRLRVQAAAGRAAAQADLTMRRIGADLHDGPAQDLAYAALRLDALRDRLADTPAAPELDRVAEAVAGAMAEVRALSRGLQLPDIAGRTLREAVVAAVEAHEARSGHAVALRVEGEDAPLGPAARVAVFRFVQEGLANGSRHAGGRDLAVTLACAPAEVRASVRDRGPGLPPGPAAARDATGDATAGTVAGAAGRAPGGMGLAGLRDRVESLGGHFAARRRPEGGTELTLTLETGALAWTPPPNLAPNLAPNRTPPPSSGSSSPTTTPSTARA